MVSNNSVRYLKIESSTECLLNMPGKSYTDFIQGSLEHNHFSCTLHKRKPKISNARQIIFSFDEQATYSENNFPSVTAKKGLFFCYNVLDLHERPDRQISYFDTTLINLQGPRRMVAINTDFIKPVEFTDAEKAKHKRILEKYLSNKTLTAFAGKELITPFLTKIGLEFTTRLYRTEDGFCFSKDKSTLTLRKTLRDLSLEDRTKALHDLIYGALEELKQQGVYYDQEDLVKQLKKTAARPDRCVKSSWTGDVFLLSLAKFYMQA